MKLGKAAEYIDLTPLQRRDREPTDRVSSSEREEKLYQALAEAEMHEDQEPDFFEADLNTSDVLSQKRNDEERTHLECVKSRNLNKNEIE